MEEDDDDDDDEVRSLSESLFGKQKKNKNIAVVTYDSVLPHTLTVVTDRYCASQSATRTPTTVTIKSVGNPRHCRVTVSNT